ncbi:MAG TPA: anthranilate synthase component I family protein [Lacipirellulaceae bacterium]|jgi:para-aminobenzoate synthetase component 1
MSSAAIDQSELTLVERLGPNLDPVTVFRALAHLSHAVFFDSAMRHPQLGRYSFIAVDPIAWWEATTDGAEIFAAVSRAAANLAGDWRPDLPPFQGGLAGMFGYELAGSFERVPVARIADLKMPTLAVGWYDVVVAFDHELDAAWLISQGWPETDPTSRRERATRRLAQFRDWLRTGRLKKLSVNNCGPPPLAFDQLAPQFAVGGIDGLTSNFSADAYRAAARRAIEYIHAGDVFQVNLAQRLLHEAYGSSVDLYCRLRERNPAPFAGYLDLGDWQVCSASPERFLRVSEGHVETRPIKGTAKRIPQSTDLQSGKDLLASAKDRAENVMIVDLLRNDLSRSCRPESVRVSQLCELEKFAWVQHLVSVVEGTLRDDQTPLDLLRRCFPGGSITGAPKLRAMEIIAELEPTLRGAYCGALGYVGVNGQMDMSILIRTITAGRGWWQLPVGGGIVADSNPQREYEETWSKAQGMLQALRP